MMLSRTSKRILLESQWPSFLPPSFLVPPHTRAWLTTISHTTSIGDVPEPLLVSGQRTSPNRASIRKRASRPGSALPKSQPSSIPQASSPSVEPGPKQAPSSPRMHTQPLVLSDNLRSMIPLLKAQHSQYATIHIHGNSYLVTQGDSIRLPFLMPDVNPGDTLRLDCATVIGSRDFTLKAGPRTRTVPHNNGAPINNSQMNVSMTETQRQRLEEKKRVKMGYLDDRLFVCRAVVTGVETEPMRVIEKTKQRNRHIRHIYSKHRYTCLRISTLKLKSLEELTEDGATSAAPEEEGDAVVELKTDGTV